MLVMLFAALLADAAPSSRVLAPLGPYVGHCWLAQIEAGTTDRHCLEPVYGGAHVRDSHVVIKGGKSVYAGETIYSAEDGRISFTSWNSLGGVGRGTAAPEAAALIFHLRMRAAPDAQHQDFTTAWRTTAAGYDVTTEGVTRHFVLDDR